MVTLVETERVNAPNSLQHYREIKGLSRAEMGRALGVSRIAVWKWEMQGNLRASRLRQLSDLLDVSIDDLLQPR